MIDQFDLQKVLTYHLVQYAEDKSLDLALPNVVFEPTIGNTFLNLSFLDSASSDTVLAKGYKRINGIMQIDINVPKDEGTYNLYDIAKDLKEIFEINGILRYKDNLVHLQDVYLSGEDISDSWYTKFLTIEYGEFNA